jgi:hypothetical protein
MCAAMATRTLESSFKNSASNSSQKIMSQFIFLVCHVGHMSSRTFLAEAVGLSWFHPRPKINVAGFEMLFSDTHVHVWGLVFTPLGVSDYRVTGFTAQNLGLVLSSYVYVAARRIQLPPSRSDDHTIKKNNSSRRQTGVRVLCYPKYCSKSLLSPISSGNTLCR